MKKTLVIVPTYNEAENIRLLIEAVFKISKSMNASLVHMLVVDDNSPDGTIEIIKKIQKNNPLLHLITGKKVGLGKAYMRGFEYGIKQRRYDYFVMMDADFSHSPNSIPILLKQLDNGADYVIGSRYIAGSKIADNWPKFRLFESRVANFLAKQLTDINGEIGDLTGGFKALRVSALQKVGLVGLQANGYAFQVNLLYEFSSRGFKIKEVPITFTNRERGNSKLGLSDALEFVYVVYKLNPNSRVRRIIRFALVGASGTVVNLLTLTFMVEVIHAPVLLAGAVAIEVSIVSNFIFNHIYTFRVRSSEPGLAKRDNLRSLFNKLGKYNLISLGGATISFTIFAALYQVIGVNYLMADISAIILAMSWNYLMSVKMVWKVVDKPPKQ
jgi:dolichol-phosphate mannosyltransferase